MNKLDERLRRYAEARAGRISDSDADLLVTRALAKPARRPRWTRHGWNAGLAVGIALLLIIGGVVLKSQLRGLPAKGPAPTPGPLPAIPNELVNLDNPAQGPELETPVDVRTGKVLPPRNRWVVAPSFAITLDTPTDCASTLIHVVDRTTQQDARPPVRLPDCYSSPIALPSTAVLLAHHNFWHGDTQLAVDLGTVMYDWKAGKITKAYPSLSINFIGGLASSDGTLLYTLDAFTDTPALDITDLASGVRVAHVPVQLTRVGLNPGGIALSRNGRTLFVNLGNQLATFDAKTGAAGLVLPFKKKSTTTSLLLPDWLSGIDADAKEGFEPGHGIAVDPVGRWIAALGADDPAVDGIWIFDATGSMQLVRHIRQSPSGFRGIAFSVDGSLLYSLDRNSLTLFDAQTGRQIKRYNITAADFLGIAGVEPR